jgi:hypothetical protein
MPTRLYYMPTRLYYMPTRLYYMPTRLYYMPTRFYYMPTRLYYMPTRLNMIRLPKCKDNKEVIRSSKSNNDGQWPKKKDQKDKQCFTKALYTEN